MDLFAVWLTIKLAAVTTIVLLLIGTPLAWWLALTKHKLRPVIEAIIALPLVLPPTVLGFYLLILMGAEGPIDGIWNALFEQSLAFSFTGLVVASVIYSLPFVVQPLQNAFERVDRYTIESAYTLGASRWRTFYRIVMPQARAGFVTATVLGFAHTVGEFGVVLMVGGNIIGETQVVSIAIYEHVEALEYGMAHKLSLGMLVFSFVVLFLVYGFNRRSALKI